MMGVLAKLKITKNGESGVLVLYMYGNMYYWRMDQKVSWIAQSGTWVTIRNATKFRQWFELRLVDSDDNYVARFSPPPYVMGAKWKEELMSHSWVFQYGTGEYMDVEVIQPSPPPKTLQIRESFDASVSYLVFQKEWAVFEIQDPATNAKAAYTYHASGLGLPIPKLPKIGGGPSTIGPWNDFTAPGYMSVWEFDGDATLQTPANVGLGTSLSYNIFDLHVSVHGFQVEVHLPGFSTGNSYSLPSSGATHGSFELVKPPAPRKAPHGKVISW